MKKSYADHLEIPVLDIDKAKKFYGKIFDWKEEGVMQQWDENYVLVNLGDTYPSFGLYKVDEVPADNKVVVTMRVDDINTKLKEIKSAGGETTREKYEIDPSVGFAANFKDPFGNIWGLHSPPEEK